jgi:hypothetical protein
MQMGYKGPCYSQQESSAAAEARARSIAVLGAGTQLQRPNIAQAGAGGYSMPPYLFQTQAYQPIGVRMKSWQPLQLGSVLQSESNIQNMLDLDSSFPCTKSDVVAWWRILE